MKLYEIIVFNKARITFDFLFIDNYLICRNIENLARLLQ